MTSPMITSQSPNVIGTVYVDNDNKYIVKLNPDIHIDSLTRLYISRKLYLMNKIDLKNSTKN